VRAAFAGAAAAPPRLAAALRQAPWQIQHSDHIVGGGARVYVAACAKRAEGIVSKRLDAPYVSGDRGVWRKIRCVNEEEFMALPVAARYLQFAPAD
jgi:bifunctional non-homologous end joining protein LigD